MKNVYLAAVAGNLGVLSVGLFVGWASPTLPKLTQDKDAEYPVHLSSDEASWIASLFAVGSCVGGIVCAVIVNIIGRKNTMLLATVPSIISWLMIFFATSVWELYISRFVCGLTISLTYIATGMYLSEIAPPKIRGNLLTMLAVASELGTAIEYMIGPFLSVKNLALVSLAGPCLFIVAFIWQPESPYHLMRCNAKQKAINSLIQLRGTKDVYEEADNIERSMKADAVNHNSLREIIFVPGNRRVVLILLWLTAFQQMSGHRAILQYAETIFDSAKSSLEGKYLTMILGTMQMICAAICMLFIDCCGRKSLFLISSIGAACSTALAALCFTLQHYEVDISEFTWLPAVGVLMSIVMHGLGMGPLVATLGGELCPINIKAVCGMMLLITSNLFAFIVTKLYADLANSVGLHVPFWIFSASAFLAALYAFVFLPETKGQTLEQIQEKLHKTSRKNDTRSV